MSYVASVRGSVVRAVLAGFAARGGDERLMRRRHALETALTDPYRTIPMARYIAMFEDMAAELQDPLFGARLGTALQPADLGPVGLLISRSASIKSALKRMTAFIRSFQSETQSCLSHADGLTLWTYRLGNASMWPRRQDAEFTITSLVQLLRAGFDFRWQPYAVHFEHRAPPRAEADALSRMIGAPLRFDSAVNALLLDTDDANRIHRAEDRDMVAVFERYLEELDVPYRNPETWRDRVSGLVVAGLGQKEIKLERLAADLNISPRSLQRRLAEEGTSLRHLVNQHRAEIAERHLQSGTVSIASLAETLGYRDGTAFWRAHRRWIGVSPSARRRAARGQTSSEE